MPDHFSLSATGLARATAYNCSNKTVTRDNRTHFVWLDAVATVCGRTYDHNRDEWEDTSQIAEGCDNHTCPCITMDEGCVRLTFRPHGWSGDWNQSHVKCKGSDRANRIDTWEAAGEAYGTSWHQFGYNALRVEL